MTVAATLLEAAGLANSNLFALWQASTLQTRVIAFANDINDDFDEQIVDDRPIGDWIAVIAAFAPTILGYNVNSATFGRNTIATFETAVSHVYRICKFAFYYHAQGLITNAQRDAILAAYNARFG